MPLIYLFTYQTWTHALLNIWNISYLLLCVILFLVIWNLCYLRLLISTLSLHHLLRLFHWTSPSIWSSRICFSLWLGAFLMNNLRLITCIRSPCYQWRSHDVFKHRLSIKLNLEGLPLFNNSVNPLAKILGFEMCTCFRTLVLLASIVISIDSLVIIEVDILFDVSVVLFFLLNVVLVIFFVRQLVKIVLILVVSLWSLSLTILSRCYMLCVHSSIILAAGGFLL